LKVSQFEKIIIHHCIESVNIIFRVFKRVLNLIGFINKALGKILNYQKTLNY